MGLCTVRSAGQHWQVYIVQARRRRRRNERQLIGKVEFVVALLAAVTSIRVTKNEMHKLLGIYALNEAKRRLFQFDFRGGIGRDDQSACSLRAVCAVLRPERFYTALLLPPLTVDYDKLPTPLTLSCCL
ncbi:hypothetical protein OUZ56_023332 [Daphnia magna]|uniref:Uncharacterized protein n=1 Tax=Daphnia magna TaxID=35525 RepID=A0ABR0AYX3_9CRUS|nr:hypothetical protein OUZ56_023332 [Daphnia magna]